MYKGTFNEKNKILVLSKLEINYKQRTHRQRPCFQITMMVICQTLFSGLERNTTQYELCSSYIRNTHVNSNRNWSQRTIIVLTTKFLLSSQQHFQTAFMTHVLSFRCSRSKDVLWKDVSKMTGQGWTTILQFPFIL